jgi:hypothetical protein
MMIRTSRTQKPDQNNSRLSHSTQHGLDHTLFERRRTPDNKLSWNAAAKPDSINKVYNPEVINLNEVSFSLINHVEILIYYINFKKRFKWDQELRRRAAETELLVSILKNELFADSVFFS